MSKSYLNIRSTLLGPLFILSALLPAAATAQSAAAARKPVSKKKAAIVSPVIDSWHEFTREHFTASFPDLPLYSMTVSASNLLIIHRWTASSRAFGWYQVVRIESIEQINTEEASAQAQAERQRREAAAQDTSLLGWPFDPAGARLLRTTKIERDFCHGTEKQWRTPKGVIWSERIYDTPAGLFIQLASTRRAQPSRGGRSNVSAASAEGSPDSFFESLRLIAAGCSGEEEKAVAGAN